jgi:hypothetical protein
MLLLEEFNDLQFSANNLCRFGGNAQISSRELQSLILSVSREVNSLKHSGRTLKSEPDRSRFVIFVNHLITIGKPNERLLIVSVTLSTFGMLQMILLESINFSHPPILIDILESPMRF